VGKRVTAPSTSTVARADNGPTPGVDLFFVNQGLHSGRDNAEFLLAIYGAMDSEYIRELGRKTHRGLEGQALHGFSAGGIAFGYRRDPQYDSASADRDGQRRGIGVRWVIDPVEAGIIHEIYRLYAGGHGLAAIAMGLNARRVPCPREAKGHRVRHDGVGLGWDVSSVRVILMNEVYRGRLIWNRSRWVRAPGTRRRRRILRPESEWIVQDRPDLRIVEDALWREVQERRARVRARYDRPRRFGKSRAEYGKYLLSGLLTCGTCGGSMTIRPSVGSTQKYGCTRRWRRGSVRLHQQHPRPARCRRGSGLRAAPGEAVFPERDRQARRQGQCPAASARAGGHR
jgi:site-specific DNA recombinase